MTTQRRIIGGPSNDTLQKALFIRGTPQPTFDIEGLGQLHLLINQIGLEDGSHDSWLIGGYYIDDQLPRHFTGYFNTIDRHGSIRIRGDEFHCPGCGVLMETYGDCKKCHGKNLIAPQRR